MALNPNYLLPYCGYANNLRLLGNLPEASDQQEHLVGLLDDSNITNLTTNQKIWSFPTKPRTMVYLTNYDMKKHYIYYNTALTYYLLNMDDKTQRYMNKAKDLHLDPDSKSKVKEMLDCDIKNLQENQPNFMDQTKNFMNKL